MVERCVGIVKKKEDSQNLHEDEDASSTDELEDGMEDYTVGEDEDVKDSEMKNEKNISTSNMEDNVSAANDNDSMRANFSKCSSETSTNNGFHQVQNANAIPTEKTGDPIEAT